MSVYDTPLLGQISPSKFLKSPPYWFILKARIAQHLYNNNDNSKIHYLHVTHTILPCCDCSVRPVNCRSLHVRTTEFLVFGVFGCAMKYEPNSSHFPSSSLPPYPSDEGWEISKLTFWPVRVDSVSLVPYGSRFTSLQFTAVPF